MGRKSVAHVAVLAVVCFAAAWATAWAASGVPGSESDPVVTKSYVDQRLAAGGASFVPVQVMAGQSVIGGEGAEIILRSGEATVIAAGANGVSDLTQGQDLAGGAQVMQNHMLLVPRDDGRGIAAVSDAWVMLRGAYTLK
ncbi:MAG: hypothetical protein LBS32_02325 [Clostridiales Family XIII bacterium]|jgi:hypothetical protein|nr:hypothetical protein [Clostridiales Family XIII bacterium]